MNCNNEQLNFTCGGDQQLFVTLRREGQAFPAELSDDVVLNIVSERAERINVNFQVGDEGKLLATLPAEKFQQPGSYGVEVVGTLNGAKWRAWRKRCIRYTPDTQPGSPRSSEQQADPYDITIDVGLVQDITPRRTSELVNDGEDGNDPFAKAGDVAEALKRYAPLNSPTFTGFPVYNDSGQQASSTDIVLATKNWVYRFVEWFKTQANGIASLVNGKVPTSQIPDLPYIPSNKKGAAGGVAELNGDGKVPTAQAQFALRGNLVAADIDSTALQSGFYRVIGQRLGEEILGGDEANGVLIQYSDGYKEQVLHVGRTAGAAAGEQVETYTRRYLPTPKRWTAWSKAGGGGESDTFLVRFLLQGTNTLVSDKSYEEIQKAVRDGKMVYAIYDDAVYILGYCQGGRATFYLTSGTHVVTYSLEISSNVLTRGVYISPNAMSQAEAEAGTLTTARTIAPSTLKYAIDYHTSDLVNGGAYNSTTKKIELKHGSTVVAEIDAAPFIVDGMVDDVRIENGHLVIDFNTESGKQDIAIPLTDIFDPSNYYTKQQTDGLLSGKASTADVGALQQQLEMKQDAISDLAEIRSGAAAGATAVQPAALEYYATQTWVGQQGFLTEHQDISGKEDKMQIVQVATGETSLAAAAGKYYEFADDLGTFDITLPVLTDVTTVQTIVFYMTMGSAPAITFSSTQPIYYHDGFELEADKAYEVNALWNGAAWVVASVEIVVN